MSSIEVQLQAGSVVDVGQFFVPESCCLEKLRRIAHYAFTGFWVNEHSLGQRLNELRYEGKDVPRFSDDFERKIYQKAMEETPLEKLGNALKFLGRFIQSPSTVGSLLPSSTSLGAEMVRDIPRDKPKRILEIGAGIGQFTYAIITKKMQPGDTLDVVEYDENFVRILQRRYGHLDNVNIIHADVTKYQFEAKYDYCLSSLPLAAFSPSLVKKVYSVFSSVMKQGGRLCYFEYMGFSSLKSLCASADFRSVIEKKQEEYSAHQGSSSSVWLNVTPARVCRLSY